jgi:hypothetical protein
MLFMFSHYVGELFMRFNKLTRKLHALFLILTLGMSLTAHGGNTATVKCPDNNFVNQAFSFGGYGENQGIEIMEVNYGIPNCPANYDSKRLLFNGTVLQGTNIVGGPFRRAWMLYVKWRIISTGKEYEQAVDLKSSLPKDMTDHGVNFRIEGSQLYVYLVTPERRPADMPRNGPRETQYLKTLPIFPDQVH